jgi:hypothetical protein
MSPSTNFGRIVFDDNGKESMLHKRTLSQPNRPKSLILITADLILITADQRPAKVPATILYPKGMTNGEYLKSRILSSLKGRIQKKAGNYRLFPNCFLHCPPQSAITKRIPIVYRLSCKVIILLLRSYQRSTDLLRGAD